MCWFLDLRIKTDLISLSAYIKLRWNVVLMIQARIYIVNPVYPGSMKGYLNSWLVGLFWLEVSPKGMTSQKD